MAQAELNVNARVRTGKGGARALRRENLVPAVVYGKGMEPVAISVDPKVLAKTLDPQAGWNTLLTLKGDGPFDGKQVIVKDMQIDPLRREVQHVDFQAVDLKAKVNVMVPVVTVGKSEGEKMGGNLEVIRHELEVVCLPTAIPSAIEIDVTDLNIGDVLHVAEVPAPEGVEIPYDVNFTVLTCTGHKAEAEEGEEAEAAEEAAPETEED
ncbi:MAG: 50S ribosomal protein L25/general stress protein Ctc [Deltaproteobacteria bacterium]|nr:MAG: 50S ribosomal protein L25/general stress protein Ctc [Deltaproteobacteria bacterium]